MKKTILLILIQVVLLTACQQTKTDDPEKLKAVLIYYFDGIASKDINKLNEVTTDDYVLFESGMVWNNDSLINAMKNFSKATIKYKFNNFKIYVDNKSGHMNYFNHADIYINDSLKESYDWVENATFRKIDDKWKLDFLHSTLRK